MTIANSPGKHIWRHIICYTSIWIDNLIKLKRPSTPQNSTKKRDEFTLTPDRYNDTNVVQDVNNKYTSIRTKTRFKACRMYLRVTFLSEICNVEGASLNMILLNNKANNQEIVDSGGLIKRNQVKNIGQTGSFISCKHIAFPIQITFSNNTTSTNGWLSTTFVTVIPTSISHLPMLTRPLSIIANILVREHIPSSQTRQYVSTPSLSKSSLSPWRIINSLAYCKDNIRPSIYNNQNI